MLSLPFVDEAPEAFTCPCGARVPFTGPRLSRLGWSHDCPSEACKATWSVARTATGFDLVLIRRNLYTGPDAAQVGR